MWKKLLAIGATAFCTIFSAICCSCGRAEAEADISFESSAACTSPEPVPASPAPDYEFTDEELIAPTDPDDEASDAFDGASNGSETVVCELSFQLNRDGVSYSVTGFGGVSDTEISIPETYRGLPVTEIADSAFAGSAVTVITIPAAVIRIGANAFRDCGGLTHAVFAYFRWSLDFDPDVLFAVSSEALADSACAAVLLKDTYVSVAWAAII